MNHTPLSKKLGSLAAATVAAASLMLAGSAKADALTPDGIAWRLMGNAIEILGYYGTNGNLVIPSTITNLPVTSIDEEGFVENATITSVTIPDSINIIGNTAFSSCRNLTNVTIGGGVTNWGSYVFCGCTSLTTATIANGVSYIGTNAFLNDYALKSIIIPDSVTNIGDAAFNSCSSLASATIGNGVTSIGNYAFSGFNALTSITIPRTVTYIGDFAFAFSYSLTKVCFEGNAPSGGYNAFQSDPLSFVYYNDGTIGWGPTYGSTPTTACTQCVGIITDPPQTGSLFQPPTLPTSQAQNLALVIHGFSPGASMPLSEGAAIPNLAAAIQANLPLQGVGTWDVISYNWSDPSDVYNSRKTPQSAARNAANLGDILGEALLTSHYQKILLIGHSAGAWMANQIAYDLALKNSPIATSVTFLAPFVPSDIIPILGKRDPSDDNYSPDKLGELIPMVEQYYDDPNSPGSGLGVILLNAVNYDITALQACSGDLKMYDPHGWPIRWYTQTVQLPGWCYGDGYGYSNAFNISGNEGPPPNILGCPTCGTAPAQSQSAIALSSATVSPGLDDAFSPETNPLPPFPPGFSVAGVPSADVVAAQNSIAAQDISLPMPGGGGDGNSGTNASPTDFQYSSPTPQISVLGADVSLANQTILAQGGNGTISTNTNGVQFSTSGLVWETFNINTTNDITVGTVDYTLSTPSDSVLGLYLDGQPITYIQSTTNNPLSSYEVFTLSSALGMGNHALTVSLESLDGTPIAATLNTVGLYYCVGQPAMTSQTVDTNANFVFTWEAGAGLKYQPQYNTDLSSTNWNNLGTLLTSPTNAMMTAFDAITTNQQRFYRVQLVQ